ncbi:MAG: tRNA lysidine(34) synthetase TilS [Sphingopyxis sp.]
MAPQVADPPLSAATLIAATAALIDGDTATARFGIAVSGGADSLALLAIATEAFPGRVAAATVDHQLRNESAGEASHVAHICAEIAVPHSILTPDIPITGSLQSAARSARYHLLEQWRAENALDWVMTAHHADDQLETMVMRINRGSGVAGLSAIRARQGHILRPLLHIRRSALGALTQQRGWAVIDDPSNRDDRFDRARVRKLLADSDLLDPQAAALSACALGEAEEALEWAMRTVIARRMKTQSDFVTIDVSDLPNELRRRLMCAALSLIEPDRPPPRGIIMTRAIAALSQQKSAMIGDTCISPLPSQPDHWTLRRAPPRNLGQ